MAKEAKQPKELRPYGEMSQKKLLKEKDALTQAYNDFKARGLSLDMSRGKPSAQQLDLSMGILDMLDGRSIMKLSHGVDVRNYGVLDGLPEAKELMADLVDARPSQVIVLGSSSLNVMFDTVVRGMLVGFAGCKPWCKLPQVRFLCPVPGYDRHFAITEHFGIDMINVPMHHDGPDMDMIEKMVSTDDSIKGIWCVPKFTNPQGIVYSDETIERFASLKPKAKDFRIFWDNAYSVHYLYETIEIPNILELAAKAGNPDMVFEFVSTSKITFSGGGLAAFVSSEANVFEMKQTMTVQTIGYDKVNMLRHAKFFKDKEAVLEHMKKHAEILRPKFEMVLSILDRDLKGRDAGTWESPRGGYFITFEAQDGCARRIVELAKGAGVVMTDAGAPFPYHKDPHDSMIRIAPSFPTLEALEQATNIFTVCVRLATIEKLLKEIE
ncbi:MAG: aminotransferase class I/II-fold pyridoxal phosphate-dependent enzyme [Lachnospiraceae bacterium]|nr:aminotransferase class I/II-fold pyridoxal phosphate-dependent enzyme [Lachnospiraceae bacterium]